MPIQPLLGSPSAWSGLLLVCCLQSIVSEPLRADDSEEDIAFFESRIRPVLIEHCYECHSAAAEQEGHLRGGLLVDSRSGLLAGGDSGPAVDPGQPERGSLLAALRYESVEMPPDGPLPEHVVRDFERWIERGAADPRLASRTPRAAGKSSNGAATAASTESATRHWAYQPLARVNAAPPAPSQGQPPSSAIDCFIASKWDQNSVEPVPAADRQTLVRRLYFDLAGLPPPVAEIERFVMDEDPAAYERLVDRLLASPDFGVRFARHWLDLVRFAESVTLRGLVQRHAWRYRDYVVAAFNGDLPYDRFVREQIAGDLMPAETLEQKHQQLIATTFLALGNVNLEDQDKTKLRMDTVDEQLNVIGSALLAQTIGCARCHDHKFDPIPTRDYYALAGILWNTKTLEHANVSSFIERPLPTAAAVPGDAAEDSAAMYMAVLEEEKIEDLRIHIRGNVHNLGEVAPRGFLSVAAGDVSLEIPSDQSGRLELGDWLADPSNPLTARVFVNRVWGWLCGEGLVRTPDNFGTAGQPPTHPELLDYLAVRFIDSGWSVKGLVREIVCSDAYRRSSERDAVLAQRDPENRTWWRANCRPLEAECMLDAILAISGRVDHAMGGSTIPESLSADYGFDPQGPRRAIYWPLLRNEVPELVRLFDGADASLVTGRRSHSTVAPQALFMMNNPWVIEHSRAAAQRLVDGAWKTDAERIDWIFRRLLGRAPHAAEHALVDQYLRGSPNVGVAAAGSSGAALDGEASLERWSEVIQSLLSSVDFRYLY